MFIYWVECIVEAKLDKWTLVVKHKVADSNDATVTPLSFIRYFAVDLVELGRAHAGYRILVQEQGTKQIRLMVGRYIRSVMRIIVNITSNPHHRSGS